MSISLHSLFIRFFIYALYVFSRWISNLDVVSSTNKMCFSRLSRFLPFQLSRLRELLRRTHRFRIIIILAVKLVWAFSRELDILLPSIWRVKTSLSSSKKSRTKWIRQMSHIILSHWKSTHSTYGANLLTSEFLFAFDLSDNYFLDYSENDALRRLRCMPFHLTITHEKDDFAEISKNLARYI